jgi:hypothetical protein
MAPLQIAGGVRVLDKTGVGYTITVLVIAEPGQKVVPGPVGVIV